MLWTMNFLARIHYLYNFFFLSNSFLFDISFLIFLVFSNYLQFAICAFVCWFEGAYLGEYKQRQVFGIEPLIIIRAKWGKPGREKEIRCFGGSTMMQSAWKWDPTFDCSNGETAGVAERGAALFGDSFFMAVYFSC